MKVIPRPEPSPALEPFQQRVVDERDDLAGKVTKLQAFLDTPVFAALDGDEQNRLQAQLGHMTGYLEVLGLRIAAFSR